MTEIITRKHYLGDRLGYARIERDLSMDYAEFLHFHKDFERVESINNRANTYYLKSGGTIEIRRESWAGGKAVVYFKECPKEIHDGLMSLEGAIVQRVNELYQP